MKTKGKFDVVPVDDYFCVCPFLTESESWDDGLSRKNGGLDLAHTFGKDAEGNAYLFASAPDMLSALNIILRVGLTKETRKIVRDAIKKSKVTK